MKQYETLIFDLDDTLINNNESLKYAFATTLEMIGFEYSDDLFLKWKKFDTAYWHTWESGKMVIPPTIQNLEEKITYLRANRFLLFFQDLKLDFDTAVLINDHYCSMLGVNIVEIEDASQVLQELSSTYEIVVATNGPKDAAFHKLEKAYLAPYVSSLVSSEEVGYSKPMKEFFNYLYRKIQTQNKSKMLLIGDSLTTDVLGGMNNGIDTCWFNPNGDALKEEFKPTMVVNKLLQLKKQL